MSSKTIRAGASVILFFLLISGAAAGFFDETAGPAAPSAAVERGPGEYPGGQADIIELSAVIETPEPTPEPVVLTLAAGGPAHAAYLSPGTEPRSVEPDAHLSRAGLAEMLYRLLETPVPEAPAPAPADVPEDAPYFDALALLCACGVLDCADGLARPEEMLTGEEFSAALAYFYPDAEAYLTPHSVSETLRVPWADFGSAGDRLLPDPDGPGSGVAVTRAEAVATLNRALGRSADREMIDATILFSPFTDLPRDHWAYYDVLEALLPHECGTGDAGTRWASFDDTAVLLPEGFYFELPELFYVGADGRPVRDTEIGGFAFGPDGRYTSGDGEIDEYVRAAMATFALPDMTREELLRAAYLYTRDSFTYLRRHYYRLGDTGWTQLEGKTMFETGKGNCYCYTSVFYYLSRQLGYDATAISGTVGRDRSPHGWVEIEFDGITYIFDTELEMAYRKKGVTKYDFYMMSYASVPWAYVK